MKQIELEDLSCPCGCGSTLVDAELLALVNDLQRCVGQPLKINSGYRCAAHNKAVGGARNSAHLRGKAADIACTTSQDRYRILRQAFILGIRRIEVGRTWIHVDVDKTLPQDVVFLP